MSLTILARLQRTFLKLVWMLVFMLTLMGAVIFLPVLRMPGLLKNLESVDEVAGKTKHALLQGRLVCFDLYFMLPIYLIL